MSDDDLLRRAARSLRDEAAEVTPEETADTRTRVLATLTTVERRRTRAVLVLLPIAAVLVASLAFARDGAAIRRVWGWIAGPPSGASQTSSRVEAPRASGSVARGPAPVAAPDLAVPPPPSEAPAAAPSPAIEPEAAEPRSRASERHATNHAPATTTSPGANTPPGASPAPTAEDEAEAASLALYRSAHRLHFVDHDYAGALAAWDQYLRAAPHGRLGVEARYNRALALVHLGRDAEARTALEPFAGGRVEGGYRQREANALLQALDSHDP